jgi:hypothetical protein
LREKRKGITQVPIVTQELLESGKSLHGSWNIAQLKTILPAREFDRPYAWPEHGWKQRLIGREISQAQYEEFLRLKDRHLAHKSRKMPEQRELWQENYSHLASIKQESRQTA